eukprot:10903488-Ditylum_brightwellii.AAC.1
MSLVQHPHESRQLASANAHSIAGHRSLKYHGYPLQNNRPRDFNTFTGLSYNMQGLKQDQKFEELAILLANNMINFLCLQETWLCGSEPKDIITAITSTLTPTTSKTLIKCTLFQHTQATQPGCVSGRVGIMFSTSGLKVWERAGSPDLILMQFIDGIGRAMGLELHLMDK